jgi:hypothetical protein
MGWPLLALLQISFEGAVAHFAFLLSHSAARLIALLLAGRCFTHRCPSPMSHLSCLTRPKGAPRPYAPPAPRACPHCRLAKSGHGISPSPSSSVSTSLAATRSDHSPTPQQAPCRRGAPSRPLLRPPRRLLRPLTSFPPRFSSTSHQLPSLTTSSATSTTPSTSHHAPP